MDRVDLKIGFMCNNRCSFCVQGDKRLEYEPKTLEAIRSELEEGRRRGAKALVVTGGEPTIHKTFLDTVRLARELGYDDVQVQSNGRTFCYPGFCRRLVDAGATEFSPSLHGATAAQHDFLTGAPGSFVQTVAGIRNLKSMGQKVITNSVVTRANYRELPALASLLIGLGVDQFQFAFVHILGQAMANKSWIVPPKSLAVPYVKEGLDRGRAAGRAAMTEAIPYCLMLGYEEHVAERVIPRTVIFDAAWTIDDYTLCRIEEGKAKGPRCRDCAYFERCEGPWKEYPELFGWDEFVPVAGEGA